MELLKVHWNQDGKQSTSWEWFPGDDGLASIWARRMFKLFWSVFCWAIDCKKDWPSVVEVQNVLLASRWKSCLFRFRILFIREKAVLMFQVVLHVFTMLCFYYVVLHVFAVSQTRLCWWETFHWPLEWLVILVRNFMYVPCIAAPVLQKFILCRAFVTVTFPALRSLTLDTL